jgi:DNA-binding CsgD family transcriptional regulator
MTPPTRTEAAGPERSDVDDFVVTVYEYIAANPGVPLSHTAERLAVLPADLRRAVDLLRHLGLVRGERPVAVSPEMARVALLLPLERAITDRSRQLADCLRWSRPFEDAFERAGRGPRPAVTRLDPPETEARLGDAAHRCATEVIIMRGCVGREPPAAWSVQPLVLDAARRGVPVRLLCPHTGRGDPVTRAYLCDLAGSGGEVRTCDAVFDRFVVFDRRTAFLLTGDGVVMVDEPVVTGLLCRIHGHVWQTATRFVPRRPGYGDAYSPLRSSILGLLAVGLTDEAIARRLGLSERTLRRHIAALMRDMSADSRFQAGVAAARAGLVDQPANVSPGSSQPSSAAR